MRIVNLRIGVLLDGVMAILVVKRGATGACNRPKEAIMSMIDATFENVSCVKECNAKELREALENACKEQDFNITRYALIKNDDELYLFNAYLYAYASDLIDFMNEVASEMNESNLAVVLEFRNDIQVLVWVVSKI